jgi:chromosome segregation ATPase
VDSVLTFAEELERRDAEVAHALVDVERLQAEVDELRTQTTAVSGFLASLPGLVERHDADVRAAAESRDSVAELLREAEAELERAGKDDERLAAERVVQYRRDELHDADAWLLQARTAREQLDRESEQRRVEADQLAGRAAELAERVREVPSPAPGLEGAAEWGARARGALLVRHSGLADERDKVVREATELVASVVGDPLLVTGVAGVRDRLERALRET